MAQREYSDSLHYESNLSFFFFFSHSHQLALLIFSLFFPVFLPPPPLSLQMGYLAGDGEERCASCECRVEEKRKKVRQQWELQSFPGYTVQEQDRGADTVQVCVIKGGLSVCACVCVCMRVRVGSLPIVTGEF